MSTLGTFFTSFIIMIDKPIYIFLKFRTEIYASTSYIRLHNILLGYFSEAQDPIPYKYSFYFTCSFAKPNTHRLNHDQISFVEYRKLIVHHILRTDLVNSNYVPAINF